MDFIGCVWLSDAAQVCKLQRCAEELEQQVLMLEHELHDLGDYGVSDYEVTECQAAHAGCTSSNTQSDEMDQCCHLHHVDESRRVPGYRE